MLGGLRPGAAKPERADPPSVWPFLAGGLYVRPGRARHDPGDESLGRIELRSMKPSMPACFPNRRAPARADGGAGRNEGLPAVARPSTTVRSFLGGMGPGRLLRSAVVCRSIWRSVFAFHVMIGVYGAGRRGHSGSRSRSSLNSCSRAAGRRVIGHGSGGRARNDLAATSGEMPEVLVAMGHGPAG